MSPPTRSNKKSRAHKAQTGKNCNDPKNLPKKGTVSAQKVKWNMRYEELKKFKQKNGHSNVPRGYWANPQLGIWVQKQRAYRNKGTLSDDHINDLDSIGFCWDSHKGIWDQQFTELEAFRKENGHCNVPRRYSANPQLGYWVGTQRAFRKKGKLPDERIRRLENIGFLWGVQQDLGSQSWDKQFKKLEVFKKENGHCNVPQRYAANCQLGDWVHFQRAFRKKGKLSDDRIRRLEKIGFLWGVRGLGKAPAHVTDVENETRKR